MQRNQYSIAVGCRLSWKDILNGHWLEGDFDCLYVQRNCHLLAEKEPDELSVGHPTLLLRAAPGHRPAEDPLDHARAQRWEEVCYVLIHTKSAVCHIVVLSYCHTLISTKLASNRGRCVGQDPPGL